MYAQLALAILITTAAVVGQEIENDNSVKSLKTPFKADGLSVAQVMIANGFSNFTSVLADGTKVDTAAAGGDKDNKDDSSAASAASTGDKKDEKKDDKKNSSAAGIASTGDDKGGKKDAEKDDKDSSSAASAASTGDEKDEKTDNNSTASAASTADDKGGKKDAEKDDKKNSSAAGIASTGDDKGGKKDAEKGDKDSSSAASAASTGDDKDEKKDVNDKGGATGATAGGDGAVDDPTTGTFNGFEKSSKQGLDFGKCVPTMKFEAGLNGRKETEMTFQAIDPLVNKGQQEALNPNIITNRIKDQLGNVCGANQAAKDAAVAAMANILKLGTRDASTADAWNTELGFDGAEINPDKSPKAGLVGHT